MWHHLHCYYSTLIWHGVWILMNIYIADSINLYLHDVSATWAYLAETCCNQLLLIDWLILLRICSSRFICQSMSLYNIIGHFCNICISYISLIIPCIPINWVLFLFVALFCSTPYLFSFVTSKPTLAAQPLSHAAVTFNINDTYIHHGDCATIGT